MSDDEARTATPSDKTPLGILILTAALIAATAIQSLDNTIANVSLAHVQGTMSASLDQVSWVLTSYAVAAAIATPLSTFLTTRYGRKNLLLSAVIVFTAASMACGASQTLEQIVIFRLLQGFSGGFLIPTSQAALMSIYPREKHAAVLTAWTMGITTAPMLGPTLGGYLTEVYSWRWAFYINLPLGALAAIAIAALMKETKRDVTVRFDLTGFVLITAAIASLQMTLDRGTMLDWFSSKEIIVETVIAAVSFYGFIVHMLTASNTFLSRESFKNRNYVIGMSLSFLYILMIFGSSAILPTMLQTLMGYPVFKTGLLVAPRGAGAILAMPFSTRLVRFVDPRWVILAGIVMLAGTLVHMTRFNLDVGETEVILNCVVQGFGLGFVIQPLTTLTFATVEPRFYNEASSLFGLVRSLSSSIGISAMATFVTRFTQVNHSVLTEYVTPYNKAISVAVGEIGARAPQGAALIEGEITRQASMIAYLDTFRLMLYIVIAGAILVPLVRVPKRQAPGSILAVET
jgi:DHA2 family multidrug resistance protein